MNIWIVDSDVSFAYGLKKKLHREGVKREVFENAASFTEELKKIKKDQSKTPHLVFLEVNLPDKSGLELYRELFLNQDPIYPKIIFYTHVSFGSFEKTCEDQQLPLPPFFSKSRLTDDELNKIIRQYDESSKNNPLSLIQNRHFKVIETTLKNLVDRFYESKLSLEDLELCYHDIRKISDCMSLIGWPQGAARGLKFLSFKGQSNLRGVRVKKELRELISFYEKEINRWKKG